MPQKYVKISVCLRTIGIQALEWPVIGFGFVVGE